MGYDWIYKLEPTREIEPGWYKLKWRPIKKGTWDAYTHKTFKRNRVIGMHLWLNGAHNGWGRSWDDITVRISLWWCELNLWVRWNVKVMAEGPMDASEQRSLDLSAIG